jgi:sialate O-acetylesterase
MIQKLKPFIVLLSVALALTSRCVSVARADVRLPALFSDNAVLQQGMRVPIWGWADEGEEVAVSFRGQKAKAKARDGKWMVKLHNLKAGGPDTLTVSGKNTIALKNVLVGEVWICSGQSNMEWPLSRSYESQADIAASANPNIHLFTVPKLKASTPVNDVKASWQECNSQTIPGFSAVAYYFGRELQKARNVPVGLVHTSWGGSPAEVWMSEKVLSTNPDYQRNILDKYSADLKVYQAASEKFNQETEELKKQGQTQTKKPPAAPYWKPTELYNGMIAPLIPYAFQGAIWYQGESNAGRAHEYRTLFADMISNWRRDWGQGNFTFLAVQLAPWDKNKKRSLEQITEKPEDSDWAELREAQSIATQVLPKVGMAVITDVGDKDDIHPTKKVPVGARLALAARGIAYREKMEYSGPVYQNIKVKDGKAVLSFLHVDGGLEARDGQLKGFAICGEDKKFIWANAEIQGNKVVVSSPAVVKPVAVRYGWSDYPVVNLWNKDGLPASPFRTDNFPMITQPKK